MGIQHRMYIDKDGKTLTLEQFMPKFRDTEYRRVAWTRINQNCYVSTVWLGINHGYGNKDLIFESMVFIGPDAQECRRYETEAEAIKGHEEMVEEEKKTAGKRAMDVE